MYGILILGTTLLVGYEFELVFLKLQQVKGLHEMGESIEPRAAVFLLCSL
jgi:hypothetical protein